MTIKVLMVISHGKFFLSHRCALAKFFQKQGYEVHVACLDDEDASRIAVEGFIFHPLPISRHGINPFAELRLIYALKSLYSTVQPDIIHHFSIKPIIYGTIAARLYKKAIVINAPTGLGYVFSSSTFKARMLEKIVRRLYYFALTKFPNALIFENPDDRDLFQRLHLLGNNKTFIIKGAGIEPDVYLPKPEVSGIPIVILPARLLWDKGVQEFVDAARQVKAQGISARFVLVGDVDANNPANVKKEQVTSWIDEGVIECWGWQENMLEILQKIHIVCLPSYREGLPKALIEAASCAKPIVTTDVPGCREVVIDQYNGFLVPAKDSQKLAGALIKLINDAPLRHKMGALGRERVQAEFSMEKIGQETLRVYQELL
jgi:glycosyltransferase involved in cell wall biosynthesis